MFKGDKDSPLRKWNSNYHDFKLLWGDLLSRLDDVLLDQAAAIFHKLWSRRNCFVFNNKFNSPSALLRSALNDIEVFHDIHQCSMSNVDSIP